MIRTIVKSETNTVSISIPSDYVGKELEIIVFDTEEGLTPAKNGKKKVSFNALSIDTRSFTFNRDQANER